MDAEGDGEGPAEDRDQVPGHDVRGMPVRSRSRGVLGADNLWQMTGVRLRLAQVGGRRSRGDRGQLPPLSCTCVSALQPAAPRAGLTRHAPAAQHGSTDPIHHCA